MKQKILLIAVCAILLILPTVVAVISYTNAQNQPVTRRAVSEVHLTTPDGKDHLFEKTNDAGAKMQDCFFRMNEGASTVSSLLSPVEEYSVFSAVYHSYGRETEYRYYFTKDPTNAFYSDADGVFYRIDPLDAGTFLASEYAGCLFPSAVQPTMNVAGSDGLLPQSITWKYRGYNDEFFDAPTDVSDTVFTFDVTGGLQLSFDQTPDQIFVKLVDEAGAVVFNDVITAMSMGLFADNTVYDTTVTAKWYQTEDRSNFGEATYHFNANVLSPAVFYVSTNKQLRYGDFVIVSAKNIVDSSLITFKSEPTIAFTPTFFEYGGYYHALVPISLVDEANNDGALDYTFTLSYGEVSQDLYVKLEKRAIASDYQNNITLETVQALRNETTIAAFNEAVRPALTANDTDLFWMKDNMLVAPSTRNIRTGFGLKVILSAAKTSYYHEGVNYYVQKGDSVMACLSGKVVYVGETLLSGTTVIIEHGGGLKSLYAHLSATSVEVGDYIQKGHSLGIVGNTGFCTGTTLHFGLYVFDVPVRYYNYEEAGVSLAAPVAEALGLLKNDAP